MGARVYRIQGVDSPIAVEFMFGLLMDWVLTMEGNT